MKHFILLLTVLFLFSCEKDNKPQISGPHTFYVASERYIEGNDIMFLTKTENNSEWEHKYTAITNFEYERGHEYKIEAMCVKEKIFEPSRNESAFIEYLNAVKILSKEQKTSENLPEYQLAVPAE